jgi:Tfp pilus assembly protein PilW
MIASALSAFVLAGVLAAFLMIGRSGFLASSYSELQDQTRHALEIFGEDVRKSADIRWNDSQSITLSVATGTNALNTVTYAYDADAASPTHQCFYRVVGDAASAAPRRVLIRNVTFRAARTGTTLVASNQSSISARYILRNKRVAN